MIKAGNIWTPRPSGSGKGGREMKLRHRLYNVIFPIWLIWLFPPILVLVAPANLAVDCLVLALTLSALKHPDKKGVLKALWWKVWLLGFGADLVGAGWMYLGLWLADVLPGQWWDAGFHLAYAPFLHPASLLWTLAGVALAGGCIYLFDRCVMNRCPLLTRAQARTGALVLAVVTAPWLFFLPLYGPLNG